jgi:dienelactone hydrolase
MNVRVQAHAGTRVQPSRGWWPARWSTPLSRLASLALLAEWLVLACVALVALDSALGWIGRAVFLLAAGIGAVGAVGAARRRPSGRALTAIGLGSMGFIVGVGYGIPRVVEGSWWLSIVPLAAAVASLGLMAGGGLVAIRMMRGPLKLLALPVALALAQFVLLPGTTGTLGAHGARSPLAAPLPSGAEEVRIVADDGVALGAWYIPGTNGAAVVVLPGAGGNRSHTIDHARAIAALGYTVLSVDARGNGDSGGVNNIWGWEGDRDIDAAVAWLRTRPGVDAWRIGLVGLSMGGEQAITFVGRTHGVHAVVSEGVEARMPADTWYVADGVRGWTERAVAAVMWAVADLWTAASPPPSLRESAAGLRGTPVLLIAADAPDERAVAIDLAARAPEIEVWQTSGVGHTQALAVRPEEWRARVGAFLDRALLDR